MCEDVRDIDPEGDVCIVLKNPNAPFAGSVNAPQLSASQPSKRAKPDRTVVRMRVSSKHLTLASGYFKAALEGGWKESTATCPHSHRVLDAEDWDVCAMEIFLNIIHGRTNCVPKTVSLEMLAKIGVLVDYYRSLNVVQFFAQVWIENMRCMVPASYSTELILWVFVSWVFREPVVFETTTRIAAEGSQGLVSAMGLPIPQKVIGKFVNSLRYGSQLTSFEEGIDSQRQDAIGRIIAQLHEILASLAEGQNSCSFECDSIRLGALVKQMHTRTLYSPRPETPFRGYCVLQTARHVREFKDPKWNPPHVHGWTSKCKLSSKIKIMVDSVTQNVKGLVLKDYLVK